MKAVFIGGSNSRNSGGVFNTATALGIKLHGLYNVDVQYLMHNDEYSAEDQKFYGGLPLHSYKIKGPTNLGFSTDMYRMLANIKPDVVHTQSIWMYLSAVNKRYHARNKTPYIVSPHGMLDAWQLRQSSLKKKLVLGLYERKHLQQATCIQALCADEYNAIRDLGIQAPVALIPNGVHLPNLPLHDESYVKGTRWTNRDDRKTLLFLSRIHPKKGLDNLLEAWKLTQPEQHNWKLVIAGETKDAQYWNLLHNLSVKLGITQTVDFIGGQFGNDKDTCFLDADAFVLPSFSEGLPMVVLEAWAYSLPVVMTRFCNIPEGFDKNAAIAIETNYESIAAGVMKLINMNEDERRVLGSNGLALVKDKFTWDQVAKDTYQLYEWVLGKASRPDFVKLG